MDNKQKYRNEMWNTKCALLFEWCNRHKKTPMSSKMYNGINIGNWYVTHRYSICDKEDNKYKKLSKNVYVKNNLDKSLDNRFSGKVKLTWDQKCELLFEWCNENKKTPANSKIYKDFNIGNWYVNQRVSICNKEHNKYKILSKNVYVKNNLDKSLDYRFGDNIVKLTWNQKCQLLFEWCNQNKKTPLCNKIHKDVNIGIWYIDQRNKICNKDNVIYKKLSKNIYVKKNLDVSLANGSNTKDMIWNEMCKILFDWCDKNKKTPPGSIAHNGVNIGTWYIDQRRRINNIENNTYKKLSKNIYVKNNIDKSLRRRFEGDNLTWEQKCKIFFDHFDEHNKIPDDNCVSGWYNRNKYSINSKSDDIYIKLSKNANVKIDLDKYLNKKKDKIKRGNRLQQLFNHVTQNKSVPDKSTELGNWYIKMKRKLVFDDSNKRYSKLCQNDIIKKDLDNYPKFIAAKNALDKDGFNKRLSWDEKCDVLFAYVNKHKTIPTNNNLTFWYNSCKYHIKINDDIYNKLTKNNIVKNDLDKYLNEKMVRDTEPKTRKVIKSNLLGWNKWFELLTQYCDKENKAPYRSTTVGTEKYKLGQWLDNAKRKIFNEQSEKYVKLSKIPCVKQYLDTFLANKRMKKLL